MKQLLTIPALFLLACNALAGSADDEAFEKLTFEYIGDLTNFSPANATLIGDHSADSRLDNVDAAARARRRDLYEDYKAALAAIDRNDLTRANQIDAEILHDEIESSLWSLNTLQEWAGTRIDNRVDGRPRDGCTAIRREETPRSCHQIGE